MFYIQQQLQALLETLSATEPHYIRCVKPNNVLKPAIFENNDVLQQLRCGVSSNILVNLGAGIVECFCYILYSWYINLIQGVMEAIRISCAGYPTRKPFQEFISRFSVLAPEVLDGR